MYVSKHACMYVELVLSDIFFYLILTFYAYRITALPLSVKSHKYYIYDKRVDNDFINV